MKRFIVATTVLLSVGLAACEEANDEPEMLAEPTLESSTVTSEESTSSESPSSESTSEEPEPNLGSCDPEAFNLEGPTKTVVSYCDGQWAHVGKDQTDHLVYAKWNGSMWEHLRRQGESLTGFPCYDHQYWLDQGAPAELVEKMGKC